MELSDTDKLDAVLASSSRVAVVSHYSPDGDAVGSVVACSAYLASRGITAVPILPSAIPSSLSFLGELGQNILICEDDVPAAERAIASADAVICLDISQLQRTEYLAAAISSSKGAKVLVDHHVRQGDDRFDLVFSTVEVSSTCELLFNILLHMGDIASDASRLCPECLTALYVGLMTDTNNFSNSVFPSTFEMGAALLRCGVEKDKLQEKVFKSYSSERMKLMGHLLYNKMHILPGYGAAYMVLTEAEKKEYAYVTGDSEGFVNLPLSIGDVRISALFTETSTGYIRVSLRSKTGTDVNVLARKWYNGGGHVNAAGGRLYIPVGEIGAYFEKTLEDYFGR